MVPLNQGNPASGNVIKGGQVFGNLQVLGTVSKMLNFVGVALLCLFALFLVGLDSDYGLLLVGVFLLGIPGGFLLYLGNLAAVAERRTKEEITWAEARREAGARAQAEAEAQAALKAAIERTRIELRDADCQDTPCEYSCVGHPNITLALRYGIANTSIKNWGQAKDGQKTTTVRLQKIKKIQEDEAGAIYLAELPDFGRRQVKVVIRPGTDFVLTFLPMSDTWFHEHEDLERLLKDNPTFTLKELATFHVQAVLNAKR